MKMEFKPTYESRFGDYTQNILVKYAGSISLVDFMYNFPQLTSSDFTLSFKDMKRGILDLRVYMGHGAKNGYVYIHSIRYVHSNSDVYRRSHNELSLFVLEEK